MTSKTVPPIVIGLVLNYRDPIRTLACINSLLTESIDHIVVWDNSEDNGASANQLGRLLSNDQPVHIITSQTNLGFAAGVNQGLDWISAHHPNAWVLLINNDAYIQPGALAKLTQALQTNTEAQLAYPLINHRGNIRGGEYYQNWLGLFLKKPSPGSHLFPSGCALLLAPERFHNPIFDEDFFMYGEDILLGWHLRRKQRAMVHIHEVLVEHEGSASSGLGSEFYENHIVAAHLILARKMAHNPTHYALLLTGRLLTLPARALLRSARYRSLIPVKALITGWKLAQASKESIGSRKETTRETNS